MLTFGSVLPRCHTETVAAEFTMGIFYDEQLLYIYVYVSCGENADGSTGINP